MQPKFFNSMVGQVYISLWSKYRPAIIQLMLAAEGGSQQYRLFDHEFKALNPKEKSYSFQFTVHKGKALNSISSSANAKDLLDMLNMSRKAIELMSEGTFEFKLDKQFILHISKI